MKFTLLNLTAFLILIILFANACDNNDLESKSAESAAGNSNRISGANSENANATKDDINELGKIIKLPLLPEEVNYWEEKLPAVGSGNENPAANSKKIVAVLKYSPENAAQLVSQIEKIKPPFDTEIDTETRFPAELIAQSQLSGDETLKGKSYAADNFLQAPYNKGSIARIENTDYFVLELTTN